MDQSLNVCCGESASTLSTIPATTAGSCWCAVPYGGEVAVSQQLRARAVFDRGNLNHYHHDWTISQWQTIKRLVQKSRFAKVFLAYGLVAMQHVTKYLFQGIVLWSYKIILMTGMAQYKRTPLLLSFHTYSLFDLKHYKRLLHCHPVVPENLTSCLRQKK